VRCADTTRPLPFAHSINVLSRRALSRRLCPLRPEEDLMTVVPIDMEYVTQQDWSAYDGEQHDVWKTLYERRMGDLRENGSRIYLRGADAIGLEADHLPNLARVNQRLSPLTGWETLAVKGYIPAHDFFLCLQARKFPTTITIRTREQLDYLPEPDMFHDVFGHVPLHSNPVFADFLQHFGALAVKARSEDETTAMARLFWFTVEFGLIREEGRVKVYGSGLISSHGDSANALGPKCDRRDFDLDAVLNQPFEIDRFQDILFVIDSFEQLYDAVDQAGRKLEIGA
jgi:phenylalanine-4-hydroxylase